MLQLGFDLPLPRWRRLVVVRSSVCRAWLRPPFRRWTEASSSRLRHRAGWRASSSREQRLGLDPVSFQVFVLGFAKPIVDLRVGLQLRRARAAGQLAARPARARQSTNLAPKPRRLPRSCPRAGSPPATAARRSSQIRARFSAAAKTAASPSPRTEPSRQAWTSPGHRQAIQTARRMRVGSGILPNRPPGIGPAQRLEILPLELAHARQVQAWHEVTLNREACTGYVALAQWQDTHCAVAIRAYNDLKRLPKRTFPAVCRWTVQPVCQGGMQRRGTSGGPAHYRRQRNRAPKAARRRGLLPLSS